MAAIAGSQCRIAFPVVLGCAVVACHPPPPATPRYLVTARQIDVGDGIRLCVAVDPADPHGVWWWGAGESGCGSRSTGPAVFRAQEATVSPPRQGGQTEVSFRLGTHSARRPVIDVRLLLENGTMRAVESGAHVRLQRRNDLDIPENR
jgi:hypothetical protein